jgi:hypothetical protein
MGDTLAPWCNLAFGLPAKAEGLLQPFKSPAKSANRPCYTSRTIAAGCAPGTGRADPRGTNLKRPSLPPSPGLGLPIILNYD